MPQFSTSNFGEVCAFLGKSERQVKRYLAAGMPRKNITARKWEYDLPSIHQWIVAQELEIQGKEHANEIERLKRKLEETDEDPEAEATKRINRQLKELDLAERQGKLVPIEDLRNSLSVLAGVLRSASNVLRRKVGNDAYKILKSAIDSFEVELQRRLGSSSKEDATS